MAIAMTTPVAGDARAAAKVAIPSGCTQNSTAHQNAAQHSFVNETA
jgi:hypothetical protein